MKPSTVTVTIRTPANSQIEKVVNDSIKQVGLRFLGYFSLCAAMYSYIPSEYPIYNVVAAATSATIFSRYLD